MASKQALRFTRVKLRNWRNFRAAEIKLGERAFLLGPNASGKSNFLDALRFLRDLARPAGGGLAAAIAERGGFATIRCLHARDPSDIEFDVAVGTDAVPDLWRYQLRLQRVRREVQPTVVSEIVWHQGKPIADHIRPKDAPDPLIYSQTKLQQVGQNSDFRDLVKFFASIRYLHVVPQIVRDARRHLSDADDPHGGDLLRRIKDVPAKIRTPRLRRMTEALKVAVPQLDNLQLKDDSDGRPHLQADFEHWRFSAARQNEEQFSDGTLRLLGFLWSLTEQGGPLLLEEPELSLHDEVVKHLPSMIQRAQRYSGRQVIASTHSRAVIDAPGVALGDVHRIIVGKDGSALETAADNPLLVEQITMNDWAISDAVLPLTAPRGVDALDRINLLAG